MRTRLEAAQRALRSGLKEHVWLASAIARSETLTSEQLDYLSEVATAAHSRGAAAREAMLTGGATDAVPLYCDAVEQWLRARLARTESPAAARAATRETLHGVLDGLLRAPGDASDGRDPLQRRLTDAMTGGAGGAGGAEAALALQRLERRLASETEVRTPGEVRFARFGRVLSLAAALVGLPLAVYWAFLAPPDRAFHRPVSVSSNATPDIKPRRLTDWLNVTPYGVHTSAEANTWVAVDLEGDYFVDRVVVRDRRDRDREPMMAECLPLLIEFSDDGLKYRGVARRNVPIGAARSWSADGERRRARFVRVRCTGGGSLVLDRVHVYGKPLTDYQ